MAVHTCVPSTRGFAVLALAAALLAALPASAAAHVKWFSEFSFGDRPLSLSQAVTPMLVALALFSAVVIGALVWVDRRLVDTAGYRRTKAWLESRADNAPVVLRVAAGAVLLLSWQADSLLVPEFRVAAPWVGWMQFAVAFLLLFRRSTPVAGVGLIALYLLGLAQAGAFHMLDYLLYVGAGWYLAVSNARDERVRGTGIPALYLTVGFSLCWVALEKIIYPQWGLYVLQQNPQLTLGFDLRFFLLAAAFVEFALGYLLIIGLLERPLALVITLVFFTTTLVFGKTEVIGHTLIHGALVVFLLEGPGRVYPAPVRFHRRPLLQTAFASVNFLLLFVVLLLPYAWGAMQRYEERAGSEATASRPVPAPPTDAGAGLRP